MIHVKTDLEDIYELSRDIFFAFADARRPLLEMALKKANLEDVFIELTENAAEEPPAEQEVTEA